MDPARLFQIITNSTLLATRLLSGNAGGQLQFIEPRYCALLPEDAPLGTRVASVAAQHKTGARVRYSITGGNRDGLFTIDQHSGLITLGAHLDHEVQHQHNLIVAAEAGGVTAHSLVHVVAGDVNDNAPVFKNPMPVLTVIEEDDRDLPLPLATVGAEDKDRVDRGGLLYTLTGDGVDGLPPQDAFFSIDPQTGVITQLRALDRDPPKGKPTWKLKVRVSDGQRIWSQSHEPHYFGAGSHRSIIDQGRIKVNGDLNSIQRPTDEGMFEDQAPTFPYSSENNNFKPSSFDDVGHFVYHSDRNRKYVDFRMNRADSTRHRREKRVKRLSRNIQRRNKMENKIYNIEENSLSLHETRSSYDHINPSKVLPIFPSATSEIKEINNSSILRKGVSATQDILEKTDIERTDKIRHNKILTLPGSDDIRVKSLSQHGHHIGELIGREEGDNNRMFEQNVGRSVGSVEYIPQQGNYNFRFLATSSPVSSVRYSLDEGVTNVFSGESRNTFATHNTDVETISLSHGNTDIGNVSFSSVNRVLKRKSEAGYLISKINSVVSETIEESKINENSIHDGVGQIPDKIIVGNSGNDETNSKFDTEYLNSTSNIINRGAVSNSSLPDQRQQLNNDHFLPKTFLKRKAVFPKAVRSFQYPGDSSSKKQRMYVEQITINESSDVSQIRHGLGQKDTITAQQRKILSSETSNISQNRSISRENIPRGDKPGSSRIVMAERNENLETIQHGDVNADNDLIVRGHGDPHSQFDNYLNNQTVKLEGSDYLPHIRYHNLRRSRWNARFKDHTKNHNHGRGVENVVLNQPYYMFDNNHTKYNFSFNNNGFNHTKAHDGRNFLPLKSIEWPSARHNKKRQLKEGKSGKLLHEGKGKQHYSENRSTLEQFETNRNSDDVPSILSNSSRLVLTKIEPSVASLTISNQAQETKPTYFSSFHSNQNWQMQQETFHYNNDQPTRLDSGPLTKITSPQEIKHRNLGPIPANTAGSAMPREHQFQQSFLDMAVADDPQAQYNSAGPLINRVGALDTIAGTPASRSSYGPKRSVLINQLGIKLDSGGCLDPSPESLYPQDGGSGASFNLFDEYQRLLRLVEVEKGVRRSIHVVETEVTVVVKDINDNAPSFPNATMFGEVQENGPIDLSVAVVQAWDADDTAEGSNARLTYSIEKNVLQDKTGAPLFQIGPRTGVLTTALCCLDRETTPEYHIQVVANDGGGLKGTGTVIVRLSDVNDNSPKLLQREWRLQIPETNGLGPPSDQSLLDLAVTDPDRANYFFYRVVQDSGWGWDHFAVKAVGDTDSHHPASLAPVAVQPQGAPVSDSVTGDAAREAATLPSGQPYNHGTLSNASSVSASVGQLYAVKTLDYENEAHRKGFRFLVQVTDRGRGGWDDPRHTDQAWVIVTLTDVNDNPPRFQRQYAHVTVREDVKPGTVLVTVPAIDPDQGGKQEVRYHVSGRHTDDLTVDRLGGVQVVRSLDRESLDRGIAVIRIVAEDTGSPPLSSTATISLSLSDVNDCAPELKQPRKFHVIEGALPGLVGTVTATDRDVWALGNGPPFKFALSDTNPPHIKRLIDIKMDPILDSGRGGATVWTLEALDREEWSDLIIDIEVTDAGGLTAINPIKLVVDDMNDHPMKPGSKTVYLWSTKGGLAKTSLGRVYVQDPDDWDVGDKVFSWRGAPHPLFSLNSQTGQLYSSGPVREGRYELATVVSDRVWRQEGVSANVTVVVQLLDADALTHAVPLTLTPVTARALTQNWQPKQGGGQLGTLSQVVERVLREPSSTVVIVSVSGSTEKENPPLLDHPGTLGEIRFPSSTEMRNGSTTGGRRVKLNTKKIANFISNTRRFRNEESHVERLDEMHTAKGNSSDVSVPAEDLEITPTSACVWLAVRLPDNTFMNAVKLHGLLELRVNEIERAMNLTVFVSDQTSPMSSEYPNHDGFLDIFSNIYNPSRTLDESSVDSPASSYVTLSSSSDESPVFEMHNPSSAASRVPTSVTLQVVDNNSTSLVTPRLSRSTRCTVTALQPLPPALPHSPSCRPDTCRNGGQCAPDGHHRRCICPGNTEGENCNIVSRTFSGDGYAWVEPLSSCLPTTITFRVLTKHSDGVLLYSGPVAAHRDGSYERERHLHKYHQDSNHQHYPDSFRSQRYHKSRSRRRIAPSDADEWEHSEPSLALQLKDGQLQLVTTGYWPGNNRVTSVNTSYSISDGAWHSLRISLERTGVELTVDSCSVGWSGDGSPGQCRVFAPYPTNWSPLWYGSGVLQIGGTAGGGSTIESGMVSQGLNGCLANLKVNGEFVDLGTVPYSQNSAPGCSQQESACFSSCGHRGYCNIQSLPRQPECTCYPGFTSPSCEERTKPVTLLKGSFAKVALSFMPDPFRLSVSLRLRTRQLEGVILRLASHHNTAALYLEIRSGKLCASLRSFETQYHQATNNGAKSSAVKSHNTVDELGRSQGPIPSDPATMKLATGDVTPYSVDVCLTYADATDGHWHNVLLHRLGHDVLLQLDDGEARNSNQTFLFNKTAKTQGKEVPSLEGIENISRGIPSPIPLFVDKRDGVTIGGIPVFSGQSLITVNRDLHDSCLDDIRIDGHLLPLPPLHNATSWGQVTAHSGFQSTCRAADACLNITCLEPLICFDTWRQHACMCPVGQSLSSHSCQRADPCKSSPCLHEGRCYVLSDEEIGESQLNGREMWLDGGYGAKGVACHCPGRYSGRYCEWGTATEETQSFAPLGVITGAIVMLLLLAAVIVALVLRIYRRSWQGSDVTAETDDHHSDPGGAKLGGDSIVISLEEVKTSKAKKKARTEKESKKKKKKLRGTFEDDDVIEELPGSMEIERTSSVKEEDNKLSTSLGGIQQGDEGFRQYCAQAQVEQQTINKENFLARDDLRAYAYEGEGSSGSSWASTISGLRVEISSDVRDETTETGFMSTLRPLTPGFSHVIDLLKNLPDAALRIKQARNLASQHGLDNEGQSGNSMPQSTIVALCSSTQSKETLASTATSTSSCISVCPAPAGEIGKFPKNVDCNLGKCYAGIDSPNTCMLQQSKRGLFHENELSSINYQINKPQIDLQRSCSNLMEAGTSPLPILDACSKSRHQQFGTLPRTVPLSSAGNTVNSQNPFSSNQLSTRSIQPLYLDSSGAIDPPVQFLGNINKSSPLKNINTISRSSMDSNSMFLGRPQNSDISKHENRSRTELHSIYGSSSKEHLLIDARRSSAGKVHDTSSQSTNQLSGQPDKYSKKALIDSGKRRKHAVTQQELSTAC